MQLNIFFEILFISLGAIIFAAIHSLTAAIFVKDFFRKLLGKYFAFYRFTYNAFSFIFLAIILWIIPKPEYILYVIQRPYDLIFRIIQIFTIILALFSFKPFDLKEFAGINQIIRFLKNEFDTQDERLSLNKDGLYKLCRHPIYTLSMIVLIFQPIMTVFHLTITFWAGIYFWIGSIFEEKRMLSRFGDLYKEYQKTTPKFLPKIF